MRYDKKVLFFLEEGKPRYNPETGRTEIPEGSSVMKHCSVYDGGADWSVKVFGRAEENTLVAHHLGTVIKARRVELDGVTYRVLRSRQVRRKAAYLLGEKIHAV